MSEVPRDGQASSSDIIGTYSGSGLVDTQSENMQKRPPPGCDLHIDQPVRGAPLYTALRQGVDYPQCVSTLT